jgi:hypothetical protein
MTGFDLLNNYTQNLEALLMKKRSRATSSTTLRQSNQSPPHHPLLQSWPRSSTTTPPLLLPTCPLGSLLTLGMGTLSFVPMKGPCLVLVIE